MVDGDGRGTSVHRGGGGGGGGPKRARVVRYRGNIIVREFSAGRRAAADDDATDKKKKINFTKIAHTSCPYRHTNENGIIFKKFHKNNDTYNMDEAACDSGKTIIRRRKTPFFTAVWMRAVLRDGVWWAAGGGGVVVTMYSDRRAQPAGSIA